MAKHDEANADIQKTPAPATARGTAQPAAADAATVVVPSRTGTGGRVKTKTEWTDEITDLLKGWHRRIGAVAEGHHRMAHRANWKYMALGIPVVVLNTVIGTSAFASLSEGQTIPTEIRVAVGVISVGAAVLTSLQTFLGYGRRIEQHRIAAIRYETLRRDVASQLALPVSARSDPEQHIRSVKDRLDKYGKDSPTLPTRLWKSLGKKYGIPPVPPPEQ